MSQAALEGFTSEVLLAEVIRRKAQAEKEIEAGRKAMQLVRLMSMAPTLLDGIMDNVCSEFGQTRDDLLGISRRAELVQARHIAMYIAHQRYGVGLAEIGRYFLRDHSTVLHAVQAVGDRAKADEKYSERLNALGVRSRAS